MSGPYRDADQLLCPACGEALRSYGSRLCCDACSGMMIAVDDLARAVADHASGATSLAFVGDAPGKRACPRCRRPMATCHLDAIVDGHPSTPNPELDRCAQHGVWFDIGELAKVLEDARHATDPPSRSTVVEIASTIVELWAYRMRIR